MSTENKEEKKKEDSSVTEEEHIHEWEVENVFEGQNPDEELQIIVIYACTGSKCPKDSAWTIFTQQ